MYVIRYQRLNVLQYIFPRESPRVCLKLEESLLVRERKYYDSYKLPSPSFTNCAEQLTFLASSIESSKCLLTSSMAWTACLSLSFCSSSSLILARSLSTLSLSLLSRSSLSLFSLSILSLSSLSRSRCSCSRLSLQILNL